MAKKYYAHSFEGEPPEKWQPLEEHRGKVQMDVLRCLKKHFDPNNIMNPGGTLGLDI